MKLKTVGAVLAGAALLGATVAGAITAEEHSVPEREFFVDPADGMNNCLIVVGSNAAAADVVSAAYVSSKIGQMAYYEEVTENYETTEVVYEEEDEVDNYLYEDDSDEIFDDFRLMELGLWSLNNDGVPDSWVVLPYICTNVIPDGTNMNFNSQFPDELINYYSSNYANYANVPWWDYDVYFDAFSAMDEKEEANFLVDTGCSFESIAVDFSIRDVECSADMCIGCMAGCDQMGLYWYENANSGYTWGDDDGEVDSNEVFTFAELMELEEDEGPIYWPAVVGISQLEDCQTYPNVYPRQYWGSPSTADGICDPVGGIEYRTTVDGYMLPYATNVWWWGIVGPESEAYGVCDENAPWPVPLYCDYCDVYFLGKHYNALSFGTDKDGYDYMFYGTPEWYVEEKVKVGETKEYGDGWSLTVKDLGIYENKAFVTVTSPDGETFERMVVIDTYTSQVPSSGEGDWGDGGIDGWSDYDGNEENDCLIFMESEFGVTSLCGEEEEGTITLGNTWAGFYEYPDYEGTPNNGLDSSSPYDYYPAPAGEAVFAVDFTKTMIGAAGTYVIEFDAYALNDYGVLREQIYPGACDPSIDPAIKVGDLEWFFDIIPANGVAAKDLDNDTDLWETGNPNFDACDTLNIYAELELQHLYTKVAKLLNDDNSADLVGLVNTGSTPTAITTDPDDYPYDMQFSAGTILGEDYTAYEIMEMWDAFIQRMSNYYVTTPVDVQLESATNPSTYGLTYYDTRAFAYDDGTGLPETETFDTTWFKPSEPAIDATDVAVALCSPVLELWLATPVELAGLCDEELSITLNDCEGNEYFNLNVTDTDHTDYQIDGEIELSKTVMTGEDVTTVYVDLEPEALVKLDENITTEMKQEYNLILIGGPVANSIVQELVDLEKTTFEQWDTSEGELEHIADAFADGKDVLIVAGKDRDATTLAALELVNAL